MSSYLSRGSASGDLFDLIEDNGLLTEDVFNSLVDWLSEDEINDFIDYLKRENGIDDEEDEEDSEDEEGDDLNESRKKGCGCRSRIESRISRLEKLVRK